MADTELLTEFVLDGVNLDGVQEWIPNQPYALGENTFEVKGAKMPPGPKRKVVLVHEIVEGPKDNVGRTLNTFFTLESQKAQGPFKAYMRIVGGPNALVRGTPVFNRETVIGMRFKAMIAKRTYKGTDGGERTNYEIDLGTIKVLGRSAVAAAAASVSQAVPT